MVTTILQSFVVTGDTTLPFPPDISPPPNTLICKSLSDGPVWVCFGIAENRHDAEFNLAHNKMMPILLHPKWTFVRFCGPHARNISIECAWARE